MSPPRSDGPPRCESCRFWGRLNAATGECRRRSPAAGGPAAGAAGRFGTFPLTVAAGWCGEHEPRG